MSTDDIQDPTEPTSEPGPQTPTLHGASVVKASKPKRRKAQPYTPRHGGTQTKLKPAGPGDKALDAVIAGKAPPIKLQPGADADGATKFYVGKYLEEKLLDPRASVIAIAAKLDIAPATLYKAINRATKAGWVEWEDPLEKITHQVIPLTLDKLVGLIEAGDSRAVIETAKNTVFKTWQDREGVADKTQLVLGLKIEIGPGDAPKVIEGQIVGAPRQLTE